MAAKWRIFLAAAAVAAASGPLTGASAPAAAALAATSGQVASQPGTGLSVAVERSGNRLLAGRDTRYTVVVENQGETAAPLLVRVSVPPWMSEVAADPGEVTSGYVSWPVTVAPTSRATLDVSGVYAYPEGEASQPRSMRVALTACAWDDAGEHPIVCATEVGQLERSAVPAGWIAAAMIGLAGLGLAFLGWQRYGTRRTPQPAGSA